MIDSAFIPTSKPSTQHPPSEQPQPQPWRWPLATLGGREPIVLAEHLTDSRRVVDLGYEHRWFDTELFVPVHAVRAGHVELATANAVTIDHGEYATHYAHLSRVFLSATSRRWRRRIVVRAGEVIGYCAKQPQTHVRFELWQRTDGRGFVAIDPMPHLEAWRSPTKEAA